MKGSEMVYPIVGQGSASVTELEFLRWVSAKAEELAGQTFPKYGSVLGSLVEGAFEGVSLEGLRPEWVNNQMLLTGLHARLEYGKVSQWSTLCEEYENVLYGYALVILESE
jgi:hypothetical protein